VKSLETATSTLPELPRTSGGFRLLREIGRGGMGVVYEAQELSSGRTVALKILAKELAVEDEAFERFRREARIAAAISDSRCVFVYGAHQVDGSPAIAMELCGGETLEHRLTRKEPIPIETAVRWTLEMLEGLEAAHAAGVVHRDLKPSNCFTTEDDHVKIGDFGLARSLERDVRLTQSGAFLGSPLYASPEQIRGRDVDLRSDLYSCGATLYALLTGRPPYGGSNVGEVLARILSEPPAPPRSIRPEIPRGLEKVVLRAMDRDPEKRFKDHAAFRAALQPFATSGAAPGGLARRFLAYVIDTCVQSILSFVTLSVCTRLSLSIAELDPDRPGLYKSGLFQLVLVTELTLYFALLEGFFGASLGKWLVGQRVVTADTNQTSLARAMLRTLVFSIAKEGPVFLLYALPKDPFVLNWVAGGGTLVGTVALFCVMRKRNGWRGLHDFVSGMRVVQTSSPFSQLERAVPPPSAPLEPSSAWPATLGQYRIQGIAARTSAGTVLQALDPDLDRSVWILAFDDAERTSGDERRALARSARLRWLDRLECNGKSFEVFEAPGGESLVDCLRARNGLEWPRMLRILSALAEESSASERGGGADPPSSIDQMWVDRSWSLRVLDEPIERTGETDTHEPRAPLALLQSVAQRMLPTDGRATTELPPDLPGHAEGVARRIFGRDEEYADLEQARTALAELAGRPDKLAFKTRAGQIALASAFPVLTVLVVFLIIQMSTQLAGGSIFTATYISDLVEDAHPEKQAADHRPLSPDDRTARQILISRGLDNPWRGAIEKKAKAAELEAIGEATELHPHPSEAEIQWARDQIASRSRTDPDPLSHPFDDPMRTTAIVLAGVSAAWIICSLLFAFVFRGGVSLSLFQILVRDKRGERASRLRCAARALASGAPIFLAYWIPLLLIKKGHSATAFALISLAVIVHAAWIAHALSRPTRSFQDFAAGTRLVPR
jgi:uncharacterized RDD family membrane protein YckC